MVYHDDAFIACRYPYYLVDPSGPDVAASGNVCIGFVDHGTGGQHTRKSIHAPCIPCLSRLFDSPFQWYRRYHLFDVCSAAGMVTDSSQTSCVERNCRWGNPGGYFGSNLLADKLRLSRPLNQPFHLRIGRYTKSIGMSKQVDTRCFTDFQRTEFFRNPEKLCPIEGSPLDRFTKKEFGEMCM